MESWEIAASGIYAISSQAGSHHTIPIKPYIEPTSLVCWNPRSLFKKIKDKNVGSKLGFHKNLCASHRFVTLSGTQSSIERVSQLSTPLPKTHVHFCSHLNHDKGGVMLSVSLEHLRICSNFGVHNCDEEGRVLYFWSDTPKGSLDVFACYFDPKSPESRLAQIRAIHENRRAGAHTIVNGDLNMAFHSYDRLNDKQIPVACGKGQDIDLFENLLFDFHEFDQPQYTCRYPEGCSKLDRQLSDLQPLEFGLLGTACNLLPVSHKLSDHFAVSTRFFARNKEVVPIRPWVTESIAYKNVLQEKLLEKGFDPEKSVEELVLQIGQDPHEAIDKVRDAIDVAAKEAKDSNFQGPPKNTQHKISSAASFFKALHTNNYKLYLALIDGLPANCRAPFNGYQETPEFAELKVWYNQQLQQLSLERSQQEAIQPDDEKDEDNIIEFGGLGSTYSTIYGLKPEGVLEHFSATNFH